MTTPIKLTNRRKRMPVTEKGTILPAGDYYFSDWMGHKIHIRAEREGGFLIADGTRVFRMNYTALFYTLRILQGKRNKEIIAEGVSIFSSELFSVKEELTKFRKMLTKILEMETLPSAEPLRVIKRIFPLRVMYVAGNSLPASPEKIAERFMDTGTTILEMEIKRLFPKALRIMELVGKKGLYTVLHIPSSALKDEIETSCPQMDEIRVVIEGDVDLQTLGLATCMGKRKIAVIENPKYGYDEIFQKLWESGIIELEIPEDNILVNTAVKAGLLPIRKKTYRGMVYLDEKLNVLRKNGKYLGNLMKDEWKNMRKEVIKEMI